MAWEKALRPTFERAEEVGQIAGKPTFGAASQWWRASIWRSRSQGLPQRSKAAYLENVRKEGGGLDTRRATEAFTDAGDYSPGTVGAAGVIADPSEPDSVRQTWKGAQPLPAIS